MTFLSWLFDSWSGVLRVLVVGALAYVALVLVLRTSGKRTLTKLNAFDLVVTVAFGSTFASILLSSDVALLEGVIAFVVLAGAQFVVASTARRSRAVRRAVKSDPAVLLAHGEFVPGALREQRVTEGEVRQAVRSTGKGDLSAVAAVVLETDGSLSVIPESSLGDGSALGPLARAL